MASKMRISSIWLVVGLVLSAAAGSALVGGTDFFRVAPQPSLSGVNHTVEIELPVAQTEGVSIRDEELIVDRLVQFVAQENQNYAVSRSHELYGYLIEARANYPELSLDQGGELADDLVGSVETFVTDHYRAHKIFASPSGYRSDVSDVSASSVLANYSPPWGRLIAGAVMGSAIFATGFLVVRLLIQSRRTQS